jgi:hypothetical protein
MASTTITFGPGITLSNDDSNIDGWLASYDDTAALGPVERMAGSRQSTVEPYGMAVAADGSSVVVGTTAAQARFGPILIDGFHSFFVVFYGP